jgi:hypothetical protein
MLFILFIAAVVDASNRAVLTFNTPELAKKNCGFVIVKQYSRRQVINLGRPFQNSDIQWLRTKCNASLVEEDIIVRMNSVSWSPLNYESRGLLTANFWRSNAPTDVVAILDSGIAAEALPYFNVVDGYDFVSDSLHNADGDERDPDYTDPDYNSSCPQFHGTKVASIIAANHSSGVLGMVPNCKILPIRVTGACGGFVSDIADAIVWAVGGFIHGIPPNNNPAKIVGIFSGAPFKCPDFLQSAINQAHRTGAIVVASTGNDGGSTPFSPASCEHVISVGALTKNGSVAAYSTRAAKIWMPGGDSLNPIPAMSVRSGIPIVDYVFGTSFAASHLIGALLTQVNLSDFNSTRDLQNLVINQHVAKENLYANTVGKLQATMLYPAGLLLFVLQTFSFDANE